MIESGGNGDAVTAVTAAARRQRMATTIDDIEAEFQRRKRRELEQARMAGGGQQGPVQQVVRGDKVGRNDPCPCGSGKKYKKCCGA
jgi:preprotein translocase subunit SecA